MDNAQPGRGRYFAGGIFLGLLLGILVGFVLLFGLRGFVPALSGGIGGGSEGSAVNAGSESKLKLLEEYISTYYLRADEVTTAQKEDGMYRGLIDSLGDPYAGYYNEEEAARLNEETSGAYYGIGCYVTESTEDRNTVISGVMEGTPAEAAGLKAGDIIWKVNGEVMTGQTLDIVVSHIKGEENTIVHLTILREEEKDPLEIDVRRGRIESQTVRSEMLEDGVGYLELAAFETVSTAQFESHLEELRQQGMRGLILDLRYNLGGNVTTVTEIGGILLPKGLVFYSEDRNGKRIEYTCSGEGFDLPLVVLVNEYSASASEILAGAVQDSGIGTVVGTQTYGKGVVQTIYPFADNTAVKLTVADYYTRNGRNIDQVGITPDVVVEAEETDADLSEAEDPESEEAPPDVQLEKAVEVLIEEIRKADRS